MSTNITTAYHVLFEKNWDRSFFLNMKRKVFLLWNLFPFFTIMRTRSYAALRAADLDWIIMPGYSLGGHILGCSERLALCLRHSARIGPNLLCHPSSIIRRPSSAICHSSPIIRHPPSVVRHPPSVIHRQSSVIHRLSSAIHRQSSTVCHSSSIIRHSSSAVLYPPSVIGRLSSVIRHPYFVVLFCIFSSLFPYFFPFFPYFLQNEKCILKRSKVEKQIFAGTCNS